MSDLLAVLYSFPPDNKEHLTDPEYDARIRKFVRRMGLVPGKTLANGVDNQSDLLEVTVFYLT